jgi:hypothetical protein
MAERYPTVEVGRYENRWVIGGETTPDTGAGAADGSLSFGSQLSANRTLWAQRQSDFPWRARVEKEPVQRERRDGALAWQLLSVVLSC